MSGSSVPAQAKELLSADITLSQPPRRHPTHQAGPLLTPRACLAVSQPRPYSRFPLVGRATENNHNNSITKGDSRASSPASRRPRSRYMLSSPARASGESSFCPDHSFCPLPDFRLRRIPWQSMFVVLERAISSTSHNLGLPQPWTKVRYHP